MRTATRIFLAVSLCAALVSSVPVPNEGLRSQVLDRLMMAETDNDAALRSKRTIGILRQLFPDISKMIEDKVNGIIGEIVKVFGPVFIQNFLGGNRNKGTGGASKSDSGTTVGAKNPYDDDDDDDGFKSFVDDDDFFKPKNSDNNNKISVVLPTDKAEASSSTTTMSITTAMPVTTMKEEEETTIVVTESVTANIIE